MKDNYDQMKKLVDRLNSITKEAHNGMTKPKQEYYSNLFNGVFI